MKDPLWISLSTLHLLHDRQLELFGGLRGIRDEGAIEGALARPQNAGAYGQAPDVEALAASYLVPLARQQGYMDGNKRSALAAMLVFLALNGRKLTASGSDLYAMVMAASAGEVAVEQVAEWVRRNSVAI